MRDREKQYEREMGGGGGVRGGKRDGVESPFAVVKSSESTRPWIVRSTVYRWSSSFSPRAKGDPRVGMRAARSLSRMDDRATRRSADPEMRDINYKKGIITKVTSTTASYTQFSCYVRALMFPHCTALHLSISQSFSAPPSLSLSLTLSPFLSLLYFSHNRVCVCVYVVDSFVP